MSHPLYVAFIWHQHQPLYKSNVSTNDFGGQYRLPWVRLHGTKDYLDLILTLAKYPSLHQTVNLVPSLMLQLEDYANGKAIDPYLALTISSLADANFTQKQYILEHFFDANYEYLIRPHPRYDELYQQKQTKGLQWCLENWQDNDYSDLLAWHNLAWFDPLFWSDSQIANWLERDKDFTLSDRHNIYRKQQEIIRRIIPEHKKMQDKGQLEITTTPYTHPILPLLADTDAARVAVPKMTLPQQRYQWSEDIPRHLDKAWHIYTERFGQAPRGLWPSEESVSPSILPYVAQRGFKWLCSDEAVLGWSLGYFFDRDDAGNINQPEYLYRPYRLPTPDGDLSIVFRDHTLSDLIGFNYSSMNHDQAAEDLIGRLEHIASNLKDKQEDNKQVLGQPNLVTIALDGENCWEFYEKDGQLFLDSLYKRLADHSQIELVTVSEFIEKFPPTETIDPAKLHSGSWIDGNFTTWIGDKVKNKAWDYLYQARLMLDKHSEATEDVNPQAWEALYAAQGSDWFWWFGEPHNSTHDDMFDQLFREHLITLYQALNEPVPDYLYQPVAEAVIKSEEKKASTEEYIHPTINGQTDEDEWQKANKIINGGSRGTMHRASIIPTIFYGQDKSNFYLRLDLKSGAKIGQDLASELHLVWFYEDKQGANNPIPLTNLPDRQPLNYFYHHHLGINLLEKTSYLEEAQADLVWHTREFHGQVAIDSCIEIAIPWNDLKIDDHDRLCLLVVLADDNQFREYFPKEQLIRLEKRTINN